MLQAWERYTVAKKINYPRLPRVNKEVAIERLFWRAGFGLRPDERAQFRRMGLHKSIEYLLKPRGKKFRGRQMRYRGDNNRLQRLRVTDNGGDWMVESLWWLDRMVRTRQPLAERMTLNWHDHFATSNEKVGSRRLMLRQYATIRRHSLGSFPRLARAMVHDPAMQLWLDLANAGREEPNENFAREFMELFTIGPVHSEQDVKELARAFTGFTWQWHENTSKWKFGFDPDEHDTGIKTIFGKRGRFTPDQAVTLCIEHPKHAEFICRKLWGYFVPNPPSRTRVKQMKAAYLRSGRQIRPVLRVILRSKEMYRHLTQGDMVKPPVVYLAGMLRGVRPRHLSGSYRWLMSEMGQAPFHPPNVAGWDQGEAFLTTHSMKARWNTAAHVLGDKKFHDKRVRRTEKPDKALDASLRFTGTAVVQSSLHRKLRSAARSIRPEGDWDQHAAAERRRVLNQLLLCGPQAHVH